MTRTALLGMLLLYAASTAGCKGKPKSTEGDPMAGKDNPRREVAAPPRAMEAGPAEAMAGVPPAPRPPTMNAPHPSETPPPEEANSAAAKVAAASLDTLLQKQRELVAFLKTIQTLAHLKQKQRELGRRNLELMEASVASMRKASMLRPKELATFMAKNRQIRAETMPLRAELVQRKTEIMKIPGAPELLKAIEADTRAKTKPLAQEMAALMRALADKMR